MTKTSKCTDFSRFYATFVKCSEFMNHNVENVEQRMNLFSIKNVLGDKCSFVKKLPEMTPK